MGQAHENINGIRTGVKALIVHEGKILVIAENVSRNGGKIVIHDFPGGGIEFGESLENALVREVKEEIGLNINPTKVVGAWEFVLDTHHDTTKLGVQLVCIGYQCEVVGEPKIDLTKNPAPEEIFDVKWFSKEELLEKGTDFIGHKGMIEAIENLDI